MKISKQMRAVDKALTATLGKPTHSLEMEYETLFSRWEPLDTIAVTAEIYSPERDFKPSIVIFERPDRDLDYKEIGSEVIRRVVEVAFHQKANIERLMCRGEIPLEGIAQATKEVRRRLALVP